MRSAPERQMMNLTGMPDIAVKVGRMASWVATREIYSRPCFGTGVLFFRGIRQIGWYRE